MVRHNYFLETALLRRKSNALSLVAVIPNFRIREAEALGRRKIRHLADFANVLAMRMGVAAIRI
jgi:hypothetical protein